jgi:hypothetical protein
MVKHKNTIFMVAQAQRIKTASRFCRRRMKLSHFCKLPVAVKCNIRPYFRIFWMFNRYWRPDASTWRGVVLKTQNSAKNPFAATVFNLAMLVFCMIKRYYPISRPLPMGCNPTIKYRVRVAKGKIFEKHESKGIRTGKRQSPWGLHPIGDPRL